MRAVKRLPSVLAVLGLATVGVVLPTVQVAAKPTPVKPTVVRLAVPDVPVARQQRLSSLMGTPTGTGATEGRDRTVVASLTSTGTSFDVAGVSFEGSAPTGMTVEARTRSGSGWGPWLELKVDDDGGPDPGSSDARNAHAGTEPLAAAGATGIEVRVATAGARAPRGLVAILVDGGHADADAALGRASGAASAAVIRPTIVTRAEWGADESLKQCTSETLTGYKGAVVHHTVNANDYTQAQVPSILRGMYAYHTQTLGWCDLGYQFLVDRFGTVYEGRAGALTTFVQGAQTGGFNSETFGVSVIGDHRTVPFSAATRSSVSAVIAWVADRADFDPAGSTTFVSAGNSKYAAGTTVTKSRVSGHRDYGATECPGDAGYAQIPSIRSVAANAWAVGRQAFTPMSPKPVLEAFGRPAGTALTVAGHGWGHGRGMSQYGAYGAAAQGLTSTQIVSFYYPGTTLGGQGDPAVRIYLSALGSGGTTVVGQSGVTLYDGQATTVLPTTATRWRVVPDSGGLTLQWLVGSTWASSGHWKGWTSPLVLSRPATGVLRVVLPSGVLRDYAGSVTTRAWGSAARSINTTGSEAHVRSVVPVEMPASWPANALQAQAIAARTYAAYGRAHAPSAYYDTCDSTSCQVYKGLADYDASGALRSSWLDARSTAATSATAGKVVLYGGKAALTEFSSSNGGRIVSSSLPYQVAKVDPYDGAVNTGAPHSWTSSVALSRLQSAYPAVGTLSSVAVVDRTGGGDWGGRTTSVRITGSSGSVTASGAAFAAAAGLRSTWWVVTSAPATSSRLLPRDLTADSLGDALTPSGSGVAALAYSGNRSFTLKTLASTGWAGTSLLTGVGPFDADNLGDVVARRSDGTLWLWSGGPHGVLDRAPVRIGTGWGSVNLLIPVGDISGDGHTDFLSRTTSGDLVLNLGSGAGGITGSRRVGAGWGIFSRVTAGDFDGDGRTDLAAVRASDGRLAFYAGLGGGTFQAAQLIGSSDWRPFSEFLSLGDLTGDGRHDVLVRRASDGALFVYPVTGRFVLGTPLPSGTHAWTTRLGQ
ncbi:SpoIID/LytB domain-containing protein [Terrabacter sp. Ter38]|uniref:SpoIID/LytB domain-containing protein n=1 Tax=Terrabacter sp. Ter38 TaxID=2926030 RepID=UPI0021184086|nr:SpoIID/LytB domain-containing protein [Terrabacter sp. Ter38]